MRIVSLAPSITQSLYDLGLDTAVVGITTYCPKGTAPKQLIGTLWEPNFEKILSLNPDLVIASKEGNKKANIDRMVKLGITVVTLEPDRSFDDICANFTRLAALMGRERMAAGIIAAARARIAAVRDRRAAYAPQRVFWEVGARPLFTISKRSFVNDYNAYLRLVNIFGDLTTRYPQISREEVLARDPGAILVIAMGDVTAHEKEQWKRFPTVSAVRANRVFVIEDMSYFVPTVKTFAAGVEYIDTLLGGRPQ